VVLAEMVLGIAGALLLEGRIPFISVFRTVFILPIMLAPIVVGLVWRYLFDANFGLVNNLLAVFGVGKLPWLAESGLAFATIVVSDIWQWTPFVFIMILAGLQNLDRSALEAAAMDGASPWQAIWRVKLPMLLPIIVVTLMMRLIDAFRVLEVIYILTFGGPGRSTEVLSLYLYKTAFVGQDLGYASTLSVLLLLIVLLLSQAVLWINNPLRQGENP
jgi:multiple sugar transport system permease protein